MPGGWPDRIRLWRGTDKKADSPARPALSQLPDQLRDAIVNAYADSLAPVFWYLLPFLGIALVLALRLRQIPLSDTAGMVARGEAVGGEEAERLEAERHARVAPSAGAAAAKLPADDEIHSLHR